MTNSLAVSFEERRAIAFTINVDAMMMSDILNIAMFVYPFSSMRSANCKTSLQTTRKLKLRHESRESLVLWTHSVCRWVFSMIQYLPRCDEVDGREVLPIR